MAGFLGGSTDWSQASVNKYSSANVTCTPANTFVTALNISGKGYLKKLVCFDSNSPIGDTLRITVDGTQTVLLTFDPASSIVMGVCTEDLTTITSTNITVLCNGTQKNVVQVTSYPYTTNAKYFILLSQPIYFNSSLLVEVQSTTNLEPILVESNYTVI
jgi:hypothetical protein